MAHSEGAPLGWLARGEGSIPSGEAWLHDRERERLAAMCFTKRRNEYLVRRLAAKAAVASALGLPEDVVALGRIGVLNHPTGAPYVVVDGKAPGLEVSLTDRAGWAVCLVGRDLGALGVDLEIVEPRSRGFVTDFLTEAEQATVAACAAAGPDGHDAAANLIWSAKESALKVLRVGLRADTRTVEVELADPAQVTPAASGGAGVWSALEVRTRVGVMPGWWRRDGIFLTTLVTQPGARLDPPLLLPGTADLATAEPIYSWQAHPVHEP